MNDEPNVNKNNKNSDDDSNQDHINEAKNIFSNSKQNEINSDKQFGELLDISILRANHITQILENYKKQQNERDGFKKSCQKTVFIFLLVIIAVLTATVCVGIILFFALRLYDYAQALVGLISSCVTYLGSILAIFLIIVKYIFPENEEKYFNELVTYIIQDDTTRLKDQLDYFKKKDGK